MNTLSTSEDFNFKDDPMKTADFRGKPDLFAKFWFNPNYVQFKYFVLKINK